MNRLDIKLLINQSCELIVEDITNYNSDEFDDIEYDSHISIEGLVALRDDVADISTINCTEFCKRSTHPEARFSRFSFPKDGTFTYYKILIPKLTHFTKEFDTYLYYNNQEGTESFGNLVYKHDGKEEIVFPTQLRYIAELSNLVNVICVEKIIFTACKLQKCLVNLQRKILKNTLSGTCNKNTADVENRDFLLSAMYVLDYLKDRAEYDKAQEIIDNLPMCQICDSNSLDIVDCGCNK